VKGKSHPQRWTQSLRQGWRQSERLTRGLAALLARGNLEWFPLRHQLQGYNTTRLLADLYAGLNVALLAFPQGMAYAMLARLPIQYGVYC
jgi:SulP family sulfate permease